MAKAHVDPVELRRFAQDLNRFNNELESLMGGLHGRLRNLENHWRDQEQRKFTEAFESTMKAKDSSDLDRFRERIRSRLAQHGARIGVEYAEIFKRIPDL